MLAADDEGFTRGRAAFETMRVYGGRPFRLEQHLARLAASAERIGLDGARRGARSSASPRSRSSTPASPTRSCASTGRRGHRAASMRDRARQRDPRLDRGGPQRAGSGSSRCSTRAGRRRGSSRRRSRRATPSAWPPRPRRRRAVPTTRSSSTTTASSSRARSRTSGGARATSLLTPVARGRDPGGRDTGRAARARRGRGATSSRRASIPLERLARGRRGLHVLVGSGADARRRGRRAPVLAWRRGGALQEALRRAAHG